MVRCYDYSHKILAIKINKYSAMNPISPSNSSCYQPTGSTPVHGEPVCMRIPTNAAKDSDLKIKENCSLECGLSSISPESNELTKYAKVKQAAKEVAADKARRRAFFLREQMRRSGLTSPLLKRTKRPLETIKYSSLFEGKQPGLLNDCSSFFQMDGESKKRIRTEKETTKQEEKTSSVPSEKKSDEILALEPDPRAQLSSEVSTEKQQNIAPLSFEENFDGMPALEPDPDLAESNSNPQLTLNPNSQAGARYPATPLALAAHAHLVTQYVAPRFTLVSNLYPSTQYRISQSTLTQYNALTPDRTVRVFFSTHPC